MLRKAALWLNDVVCVLLSYILALLVRFGPRFWMLGEFGFSNAVALSLISLVTVANYLAVLNRGFMRRGPFEEFWVVVKYNAFLLVGLLLVVFGFKITPIISRIVIPLFVALDIVVMFVMRLLVKRIARSVYGMGLGRDVVILVASKGNEQKALAALELPSSYRMDGILSVQGENVTGLVHGEPIKSSIKKFADSLVPFRVDCVYFAAEGIEPDALDSMAEGLRDSGVNCYLSLRLPVNSSRAGTLSFFGGVPSLVFAYKERKPYETFIKRFVDIVVSVVGLIFTVLVGVVLVPLIKIESPGPVIFSQIRVGKNGRQFRFYKFRSMYQDAEERKQSLMGNNRISGLMFKVDDDPRITRVGRFIRKTSLDELPQFWNVLVGEMSLVGTRPPTMDEFARYTRRYKRRLSIKPGITGLWQVSGRSSITNFEDVLRLDLEYIDSWSLALDARILLKTIVVVFRGVGAE